MVDYYTTGQYLKFNRSDFLNSSSFSVTWPLNFGPSHVWQVIFLILCDLYQTWYTGSTRWQMHNGMTLIRIQGQGQGHGDPIVAKLTKLRQAVSQHKMRRKIGLLLHKVRFQLQICANQYFPYLIYAKQTYNKAHFCRCLSINNRQFALISGNSVHVVQPTSVKNLTYLLHEYSWQRIIVSCVK